MTLLIVLIASVICTFAWRRKSSRPEMKTGLLCLIYWISFVLCSGEAVLKAIKYKEIPFSLSVGALIHDGYTGIGILAVGLILWLAIVILVNKIKNR